MRKTFTKMALLSLAMLAVVSCKEDKTIEGPGDAMITLSKEEVKFTSPNDSTITINIESNVNWIATKEGDDGADWLTLTPENGKGGAEAAEMAIHVTANTGNTQREALVRVSSAQGTGTKELKIVQFPALGQLGKDSLILATFYEAAEGWNWDITWVLEDPISTWYGVTVAIAGGELRVTKLDFQETGKIGMPIPEEFQNLDQLVDLMFYQNQLGGKLPEWLPKLTKLKSFCAAECGMNGPIPESYWDMTQLEHLRLENNSFTGPLSPKIGQLVNLQEIKLHGCPLRGEVPGTIGKMSRLRDIDLYNCGLTGELPEGIGEGAQIENIRFDGNNGLTGAIPESWGNIEKLRTLNISFCTQITSLPKSFSKCKDFWELTIEGCKGIKSFPEEWIDAGLEYIRAYECGLTSLPVWGGKHPTLGNLNVELCFDLEGSIPEFVGHLSHGYFTQNFRMTGELPQTVIATKTLQNFSVDSCINITGELPSSFWLNPFVELNLKNTKLSGKLPTDAEYGDIALGLQSLDITNCKFYGPLPSKFFEMPKLQSAKMRNNNFTGTVPASIAYNDQLGYLFLSGNRLSGDFPAVVKSHQGWSSYNMWDPIHKICPQQEGYSFNGTTCTEGAPVCEKHTEF